MFRVTGPLKYNFCSVDLPIPVVEAVADPIAGEAETMVDSVVDLVGDAETVADAEMMVEPVAADSSVVAAVAAATVNPAADAKTMVEAVPRGADAETMMDPLPAAMVAADPIPDDETMVDPVVDLVANAEAMVDPVVEAEALALADAETILEAETMVDPIAAAAMVVVAVREDVPSLIFREDEQDCLLRMYCLVFPLFHTI
jgi:hypothetical protein